MDRLLKAELKATVRDTIQEVLEGDGEVYLNQKEFLATFGMFTKEWMARYGKYLPRVCGTIVLPDGTEIRTKGYGYPKHKIGRMIREGVILANLRGTGPRGAEAAGMR